jgi:hypothetical protein
MTIANVSQSGPSFLQESRIVAISVEYDLSTSACRTAEPPPGIRLQQLIDNGTLYVAQNLTTSQFATLQAIAGRVIGPRHPERLAANLDATLVRGIAHASSLAPVAVDYQLGLDELDTITRTRTGYSFAELPDEIQDAVLSLVASHDLTTSKLDLALWLEDLQSSAAVL